jgi:hypothetical protein
MNPFSDGSSDTLAEGVVDAVSRLREPACACLRDVFPVCRGDDNDR